nr:RNA-binding protein 25-like [Cherax quadricarinatus]XP_053651163.1 RNA-binding protein 25-like [Cherax quadricarinatus]
MEEYQFWMNAGSKLGITGKNLESFISAKIQERLEGESIEREERQLERDREENKERVRIEREEKKERERIEREIRERQLEREREDQKERDRLDREERAREREEQAKIHEEQVKLRELEERAKDREHELIEREKDRELEKSRLELQNEKLIFTQQQLEEGVIEHHAASTHSATPNLPLFTEGEDITSYIIRFENTATLCEWPADTWATRLGMLFSGTALNIYATLSQDIICNYNLLKKAILNAYQKTTNYYRKDFRYATLQPGQNFQQLQATLFRLFDFWIESSGIDHSYESLRDFMVAD